MFNYFKPLPPIFRLRSLLLPGPNFWKLASRPAPAPRDGVTWPEANEPGRGGRTGAPAGSDWHLPGTRRPGPRSRALTHAEPGPITDFHLAELGNGFEMLTTVKLRSPKPFHRLKFGCRSPNRRRERLAPAQAAPPSIIRLAVPCEVGPPRGGGGAGAGGGSALTFRSLPLHVILV